MKLSRNHPEFSAPHELAALLSVEPYYAPPKLVCEDLRIDRSQLRNTASALVSHGVAVKFDANGGVALDRDTASTAKSMAASYMGRVYKL